MFHTDTSHTQSEDETLGPRSKVSLLDQHSELKKKAEGERGSEVTQCGYYRHTHNSLVVHKVSEMDKQMEEEAKILHNIKESSALMSVSELAKGVMYTEPLTTG